MRRVWDALLALIVTLFVVRMILDMLQPYMLHIVITVVVVILVGKTVAKYRRW